MSAEAFLKEANIMKELQHKNLLKLHCVCTKEEPVYIITELMKCSLLEFLKDGEGKNITMRAQIEMSANIAEGNISWFHSCEETSNQHALTLPWRHMHAYTS